MKDGVYAVNAQGELLHEFIMKAVLGTDIPEGFEVQFVDGDTLNCQRNNLMLVPTKQ
jgi:hypothetical protein